MKIMNKEKKEIRCSKRNRIGNDFIPCNSKDVKEITKEIKSEYFDKLKDKAFYCNTCDSEFFIIKGGNHD